MKKIRRSPVVTGLLFLMAVVLLFAGSVGGTQAALQVYSENYYSKMELDHIGLTLLENDKDVSNRIYGTTAASGFKDSQDGELILNHLGTDPSFKIGKKYDFKITAINSGEINTYLRVTVYKYWADVGEKEPLYDKGWFHGLSDHTTKQLDNVLYNPDTIHLGYGSEDYNSSAWIWDEASHTDERDCYYYVGEVLPGGKTEPLFDTLWIDPSVAKIAKVETKTSENSSGVTTTTTTYTYDYDGLGFVVQLEGDAIQTHNACAAIRSTWGMGDVNILSKMKVPAE